MVSFNSRCTEFYATISTCTLFPRIFIPKTCLMHTVFSSHHQRRSSSTPYQPFQSLQTLRCTRTLGSLSFQAHASTPAVHALVLLASSAIVADGARDLTTPLGAQPSHSHCYSCARSLLRVSPPTPGPHFTIALLRCNSCTTITGPSPIPHT